MQWEGSPAESSLCGVFRLAGVTLADHMERKENERKLSDSPPLLYKSAIN